MESRKGFSIIEVVLAIVIIGIFAAIVMMAINPPKGEADDRNAQRREDVKNILNAVFTYAVDNKGEFPKGITAKEKEICRTGASSCRNGADLSVLVDAYELTMPVDPLAPATGTGTSYVIFKNEEDKIVVRAPKAEKGEEIGEVR